MLSVDEHRNGKGGRVILTPPLSSDLKSDARAHVHGALGCIYDADKALLNDDRKQALISLDTAIVLAREARKYVLGEVPKPAPKPPELPGL